MAESKIFTPAKANLTLPFVKKVVEDILRLGHEIRDLSGKIKTHPEEDPQVVKRMDELEEHFNELEAIGCSYRDWNFSMGLVDFPAVIDGQEVLLCWRSDEDALRFYHELEAGYAGRKPIPKKYLND